MTTYVAPNLRVLYSSVPKAACTTVLTALMVLEGHDLAKLAHSDSGESTQDRLVHDFKLYPVPRISVVSDELRRTALTDPDWWRIGVVRDPYSRVYAAWESKFLLNEPQREQTLSLGLPDLVFQHDGKLDLVASFHAFLEAMALQPKAYLEDHHLAPQLRYLTLDLIDYTELVTMKEVPDLLSRLAQRAGRTFEPTHANRGLGISIDAMYDARHAAVVEELYANDFAELGFKTRTWPDEVPPLLIDRIAISLLEGVRARNSRIGQLSLECRSRKGIRYGARTTYASLRRRAKEMLKRS